jgi:hypothetical protein
MVTIMAATATLFEILEPRGLDCVSSLIMLFPLPFQQNRRREHGAATYPAAPVSSRRDRAVIQNSGRILAASPTIGQPADFLGLGDLAMRFRHGPPVPSVSHRREAMAAARTPPYCRTV